MTDTNPFNALMEQGSALHAAGHAEQALVSFKKALAIDGASVQAVNACATLLSELGQTDAAFQVLLPVRAQLMQDPDGATNFAIAAESVGRVDEARAAYTHALTLDPTQIRARNNLALMQAQTGDWTAAIDGLIACRDQRPDNGALWLNLIDTQIAARLFSPALDTLVQAMVRFPGAPELTVRQAIALAFDGQIESAQGAMDGLTAPAQTMLTDLVAQANRTEERLNRTPASAHPDAYELFCKQAFEAMQVCDWRDHDRLTAVLREMLARAARTGQGRDWRDAQLCGLMLPLHEEEMAQMRLISIDTIGKQLRTPIAPYVARRSHNRDDRIHVGLAVQNLRDARVANALQRQLALHDHTRFAIHVYSPTPQAEPTATRRVAQECAGAIEIAHLSDDETVARIRLDELDIFVDMAFNSPWCRPEIPQRRVAPIQIRQTTWHRHHPPVPCEYNMSDTFVHPDTLDLQAYGAVVRLPHTCWLATNDDQPDAAPPNRADAGLPANALVLCAFVPPLMIDPHSFGLWMTMLRALPQAVLWLPCYAPVVRNHLLTAAAGAGIDASRLVFQQRGSRQQTLSQIRLADLFIDTVRFNANQGLVDALRMGVPAVTCAGQSMASRLGGSILRAAGLPDTVTGSESAFVDTVVRLGNDTATLQALRVQLAQQHALAPLFDTQARVREWEMAWQTMVQRHRAGQPPAAFDVAAQPPTVIAAAVSV